MERPVLGAEPLLLACAWVLEDDPTRGRGDADAAEAREDGVCVSSPSSIHRRFKRSMDFLRFAWVVVTSCRNRELGGASFSSA